MPRDGSDNYTIPVGTDGVPDTTISSTKYNGFIHDVEQDLNTPRPIVSGGTGASNATEARANLQVEVAHQTVTNFNSHTWETGSFTADNTATGSPVAGHHFTGTYLPLGDGASVSTLVAWDNSTSPRNRYVRERNAGVWGAWYQDGEDRFVNTAGDTMTGDLVINKVTPTLWLNTPIVTAAPSLSGSVNNKMRWSIHPGSGEAESTGNVGSNFWIVRYNDAGVAIDTPLRIERYTGNAYFSKELIGEYDIRTTRQGAGFPTQGAILFGEGPTTTKYLLFDGTQFSFGGGPLVVSQLSSIGNININGDIQAGAAGTTANYYFGSTGTVKLNYDATQFNFTGGAVNSEVGGFRTGPGSATSVWTCDTDYTYFTVNSAANYMRYTKASGVYTWTINSVEQMRLVNGGNLVVATKGYQPGGGAWLDSSDARIKSVESDYTRGLADIVKLRPVNYSFKGNDTLEPPAFPHSPGDTAEPKPATTVPYPNSPHFQTATDQRKFTGLIAQEVMDAMPEMVTIRAAYIDGQAVTDLHDLDTSSLIYALINAVKELSARIEALEGGTAARGR